MASPAAPVVFVILACLLLLFCCVGLQCWHRLTCLRSMFSRDDELSAPPNTLGGMERDDWGASSGSGSTAPIAGGSTSGSRFGAGAGPGAGNANSNGNGAGRNGHNGPEVNGDGVIDESRL